jgi:hypothetical protein
MSQSGRPLLSNVYNQSANFSSNRIRTSLVAAALKAFPIWRTYENPGEGAFYTVWPSVISVQVDMIRWTVQSREIIAKKTPDRRGPEESKVKCYQKTSLWWMCCTFVKWTTAVITVNIPINRASYLELTINYCRGNLTCDNIIQDCQSQWSKAWTVFACSHAWIVGLNPTQGLDVCVCVYSVCVILCRQQPCDGLITRPKSPTVCVKKD